MPVCSRISLIAWIFRPFATSLHFVARVLRATDGGDEARGRRRWGRKLLQQFHRILCFLESKAGRVAHELDGIQLAVLSKPTPDFLPDGLARLGRPFFPARKQLAARLCTQHFLCVPRS